jgi:hypothetical protein
MRIVFTPLKELTFDPNAYYSAYWRGKEVVAQGIFFLIAQRTAINTIIRTTAGTKRQKIVQLKREMNQYYDAVGQMSSATYFPYLRLESFCTRDDALVEEIRPWICTIIALILLEGLDRNDDDGIYLVQIRDNVVYRCSRC